MGMCNKVFKYAYDVSIKKACPGKIRCINSSVGQAPSRLCFAEKNMKTQPRVARALGLR